MLRRFFRRNPWSIVVIGCLLVVVIIMDAGRRTDQFQSHRSKYFMSKGKSTVKLLKQNQTDLIHCDENTIVLSTKLDIRIPWRSDPKCSHHSISHMMPKCRPTVALASFPGSGNTWLRHMLEGASGLFTGSRYKDLQIQMFGLWGEIRQWNDGTTIVQKTHDASKHHVLKDFGGRGILIVRNPYDAILSTHNFLYAGHHGTAPKDNFKRKDWEQFITIQTSKWLDMVTNWTLHSDPNKVLVVHYENLKLDLVGQLDIITTFLNLPFTKVNKVQNNKSTRIQCLLKYKDGFFKRDSATKNFSQKKYDINPFPKHVRDQMDDTIDYINNNVLQKYGYSEMPTHLYPYYRKTDDQLLNNEWKSTNSNRANSVNESNSIVAAVQNDIEEDKKHGTQMVIDQYLKQISNDHKTKNNEKSSDSNLALDLGDKLALGLLKMGAGGGSAKGLLSAAVEYWPKLQRPFAKDPIDDVIQTDSFRGKEIKQLPLP